jgi:hypothetical protein
MWVVMPNKFVVPKASTSIDDITIQPLRSKPNPKTKGILLQGFSR